MYQVLIERAAERDLNKLPDDIFNRIVPFIKQLSRNPRPPGCHKITSSKNDWRIRIGEYLVIYEIDDKAEVVRIMRVRHRKDAYR